MVEISDAVVLEQFATSKSEDAFAELVRRHIGLVHSVSLRHTHNPEHAQEITQAVFIILARKAPSLGPKTVLSGWLYHTARLTAANFHRAESRRLRREQEAFMQSSSDSEDIESAWRELCPFLEDAMSQLGATDRDAIVLRFFENRSLREVGTALGLEERAAQKRVARGLEKLRLFFTKRGLVLSAAVIAGAVSANSVQAAPIGLATAVAAGCQGSSVAASTLTLVKGALKIMAWTKTKIAVVTGIGVLLVAGTTTVVVQKSFTLNGEVLRQRLPDGSLLVVNQLRYGSNAKFVHGKQSFNFTRSDGDLLAAEFKLSPATPDDSLLTPAFFRQYRCVIHGDHGIEFIEEFWPGTGNRGGFGKYSDGDFGYVDTSIFPRESRWLWFRIEKAETNNPYGAWQTVAEFKARNPARPANETRIADSFPVTHSVAGLHLVLSNVTVQLQPLTPRDIWNHTVKIPIAVFQDGTLLTNWGIARARLEDSSGNWDPVLQYHRSLDPRFVWKLDMDFEPLSGFADTNLVSVDLPNIPRFSIETNLMGLLMNISWDGQWISASIPTNNPNLALRFVTIIDRQGRKGELGSGGDGQYECRHGHFSYRSPDGVLTMGGFNPAQLTLAVVPNAHTTFYVQPQLIPEVKPPETAAQ